MKGRLIVVEGTDCSGKETQTKMLKEKLVKDGNNVKIYSFPVYDSPTGKIVGGPYLGKSYICDGWFPEGAPNVDFKVSSLYYAADRLYNIKKVVDDLENGIDVILDRYTYSNMAHQGGKEKDFNERKKKYKWIEELEFGLLNLPIPDIRLFLHMPTEDSRLLRENRKEALDQNESDENHLRNAERAYLEVADYYDFIIIECVKDNKLRSIEDINDELYKILKENVYTKKKKYNK